MFSVIIPAYNCEKTIVRVLDSVRMQTRFDLIEEIIVINDGSSDDTDNVITDYIKKSPDTNILYEKQDNHGVSYTRNRGIMKAKADWIALLDADDLWLDNKIERQFECIRDNPLICFLGAVYPLKFIGREKKGIYKVSAKELCIRTVPQTSSIVFKKDIGIQLGLFDPENSFGEDMQFYQKFLLKDSYYVLSEELTNLSFEKEYFAQSGLTSNLKKMHKGRNQCVVEMYEMGMISRGYLVVMLCLNQLKYLRRCMQKRINKLKYSLKEVKSEE